MIKKILFVCKHNRFRSKVAEAVFNKLNKNKNYKAKSAGIKRGRPIDSFQKSVCKGMGIRLRGQPKGLSTLLLRWQDITIVVADDVPQSIFKDNEKYGKKLIVWKIPDAKSNKKSEILKIAGLIEVKIKKFIKSLK